MSSSLKNINEKVGLTYNYFDSLLFTTISKASITDYDNTPYYYLQLPRVGTVITLNMGFNSITNACREGNKKACNIQKSIKTVKLFWDNKLGVFNVTKLK